MVVLRLSSYDDVRLARDYARALAEAAGIPDPDAVALVTDELGRNCVEYSSDGPSLLWIACKTGFLSLRFENPCEQPPSWCSRKPIVLDGFRTGGYGLLLARALARSLNCRWERGRAIVCTEFDGAPCRAPLASCPDANTSVPALVHAALVLTADLGVPYEPR